MSEGPFVGRNAELARLEAELGGVREGGRILLITGEAGIGKTRLLAEFGARAKGRAQVLVGRGSPLGSAIPFSLVVEALESHLRTLPPARVAALAGPRAAALRDVLPSVAASGTTGEHGTSRAATLEAVLYLLESLARERPLVVVLDDVHRADPSSWELLSYLARNPARGPVLVIAALRDEGGAVAAGLNALRKDGLAVELRIGTLARDDVEALAQRALGATAAASDATWVFDRTGGNALFTTALLEQLSADPSRRDVPRSVRAHVEALTDGLAADGRDVLATAAVLGHTFSLRTIARLIPTDAGRWLDELERRGVLRSRGHEGGTLYDFGHPLMQEVAYDAIGAAHRRELHERLASALADESLAVRAYHAARGALHGDAEAIALVLAAAREAEGAQAHREALQLLAAARSLLPKGTAEWSEVLDEIGWQAAEAGEHAAGIAALRELIPIATPGALATLHMRLASLLSSGPGELAAAEAEANEAIRLLTAAGNEGRLASALNELAWIRGELGDLNSQLAGSREALRRAEALRDDTLTLHALGSIGYALTSQGDPEAVAVLRRSTDLAASSGDQGQLSWHAGSLGLALICTGRLDEATRVLDALVDAGNVRSALPLVHRAFLNFLRGRWGLALEDHRSVEALHPGALPAFAAWTATIAGLVELGMGRDALAARHLEQAGRVYASSDFYWHGALHDWASGVAQTLGGDVRGAEVRIARAAARAEAMGARPIELFVLTDLVDARAALDDLTGAATAAARVTALASELGSVLASAHSAFAEGVVASRRGRHAEAASRLREAADLAESIGLRPLRARALEHLARVSPDSERVSVMADAARGYAAFGATRYEERATAQLRSLGVAGRRSAQTVGALTPREREVVALARQGLGNKEIAARLHLSERTIESHLAHIYGKLGVAGREQLPEA